MTQSLVAHMVNLVSQILSVPVTFPWRRKKMAFWEMNSLFIPSCKGWGKEKMQTGILKLGFLGKSLRVGCFDMAIS